jgi:hypothetical protein
MKLCVVKECPHRHEDGWTHVAPRRDTPTRAHLRVLPDDEPEAA